MRDPAALSLAFIDRKPQAAARALNALPVAEAAAFLETIPSRYVAAVLARLGPWSASRLVAGMGSSEASAALAGLPYLDGVAILRLLPPAGRAQLLAAMPRRLRRDFEATMAYPADTVGGQMSTDFIALEATHTVGDSAEAFRKGPAEDLDVVFVTSARRAFLGAVPAARLFRHASDVRLGEVMEEGMKPLSARQTLASAAGHPAWRSHHWLPVIGRRKNLVGALSVRRLRAEPGPHAEASTGRGEGLLAALAGEYAAFGASLVELLARGAAPGAGAPPGERHDD